MGKFFIEVVAAPNFADPYLAALVGPTIFKPGVTIYYALEGRGTNDALGGSTWASKGASAAFVNAVSTWKAVCNIDIRPSPFPYTAGADRGIITWLEKLDYQGSEGPILGHHDAPEVAEQVGGFNNQSTVFTTANNARGGYSYVTFLHEIGHAMGLEHPHDGDLFPGVSSPLDSGDNGLNQSIFTIMSYLDGYNQKGMSPSLAYGWQATPGAFDIAAVQAIYGVNTATGAGDTVYAVPGVNAAGTFYATIWDASGNDTISATGIAAATTIDLRAATLQNAPGGGGWLSSAQGIYGGFTIAKNALIENAIGGNGNDRLTGNDLANLLTGGPGADVLNGGGNIDTAMVSGVRAAYSLTQGAAGVFTITGPDGTDTLTGIEFVQFADQKFRLLPGTGAAVDFSASPASFMAAIRDFDGNAFGSTDKWLVIGQADVNGDGDTDMILVNREIGRFAEVAVADDGLVYFSDHGWAGETRVVGIYVDPLVAAGQVVAGGDHDSQRRFQNDLSIENINQVLGAGDYDRDGLQEVYFALTDGSAFLHAYMHADGNIRYANYQSQQQVIDYLVANGVDSQTYADWFV